MADNISVVRAAYKAFSDRDPASLAAVMDRDVEIRQTEELPWGGAYKGYPDGVHPFFSKLLANVDSRLEVDRMFEAGNAVVVIGKTVGTAKASGKSFAVNIAHIWKIRDGKIVAFEPHIDTPAMLSALKP